jgi:mRNA-degrading endonuclease RelE of RelBE toxin-antitoxin system
VEIKEHPTFQKNLKKLIKKYPSLRDDILREFGNLTPKDIKRKANPYPKFHRKIWSLRIKCLSTGRGKSFFRVDFYFNEKTPDTIWLINAFPKSDIKPLSPKQIKKLLKELEEKSPP